MSLTRVRTCRHTVWPIWDASMFSLSLYSTFSWARRGASPSTEATEAEKSEGMMHAMK